MSTIKVKCDGRTHLLTQPPTNGRVTISPPTSLRGYNISKVEYEKTMSPIRFTNILFDFMHLHVSHLSNAALPFRKRFTRVPSV